MKNLIIASLLALSLTGCQDPIVTFNPTVNIGEGGGGSHEGLGGSGGQEDTTSSSSSGTATSSTTTTTTTTTIPECLSAEDCPVSSWQFCSPAICEAGICGFQIKEEGTVTPNQVGGNCLINVCSLSGEEITVPDDSDILDDNNDCTEDICSNGVLSHSPLNGQACTTPDGFAGTCNNVGNCLRNHVTCQHAVQGTYTCPSPNAGQGVLGSIFYGPNSSLECEFDNPNLTTPSCVLGAHCIIHIGANNYWHGTCI